jgi:hypothetical protein
MYARVALLACVISGCSMSHEAPAAPGAVAFTGWLQIETPEGRWGGEELDAVWEPGEAVHLPGCVLRVAGGDSEPCTVYGRPMHVWDYEVHEGPDFVCVGADGLFVSESLGESHMSIVWCAYPRRGASHDDAGMP